jgi:O-antigen/teichoic acid export membrane protein
VLARGVGRGTRFLLHVVVGRILGPVDFGIYIVAVSALIVVQKLDLMGLDRVGIRYGGILVSKGGRGERIRFLVVLLGGATLLGLAVGAVLVATPSVWERALSIPPSGRLVAILGLGLPLLTLSMALSGLLRGSHRPGAEALWTEILIPVLNLGLLAALPLVPGAEAWTMLEVIAAAFILSHLLPTLGMAVQVTRDYLAGGTGEVGNRILPPLSEMRTFALGVWAVGAITVLLARVDRILVARFLPPEAVGLYAAAAILAQQNAFFVQSIAAVAAPRFALLERQGGGPDLAESAGAVENWTAIISIPVVLATILLAPDLLGLLGAEFRSAWVVLVILSAAQGVNVLTGASGSVLNMTGGERDNVVASGIGLAAMIVLASVGASVFGVHGAAVGVGAAWASVWIIQRVAMTRRTGPPFPAFDVTTLAVPTVVASLVGVLCLRATPPGLVAIAVTGPLTLAAYAASMRAMLGRRSGAAR